MVSLMEEESVDKVDLLATTAQKMKFSIKDFFSKYDQIRSFLRFIFCAVHIPYLQVAFCY